MDLIEQDIRNGSAAPLRRLLNRTPTTLLGHILTTNLRVAFRTERDPVLVAVIVVVGAIGLGALSLFLFTTFVTTGATIGGAIVLISYVSVGTFQLVTGIRWSIDHLYLSSDLEVLLAAPVPHHTLVASKVISVAFLSPLSVVFVGIISLSFVLAAQRPTLIPLAAVSPILLALLMAAIALVITLPAARMLSAARIKMLLALLPLTLMVPVLFVSWLVTGIGPDTSDLGLDEMVALVRGTLIWFPPAWPGELVAAGTLGRLAHAGVAAAALIAAALILALALPRMFKATFYVAWGRLQEDARPRVVGGFGDRFWSFLPGPVAATVVKDMRMMRRDPQVLLPVVLPLVAVGVVVARITTSLTHTGVGSQRWAVWLPLVMTAVLAPFAFGVLAAQTVAMEGGVLGALRTAPMRGRDIFAAKVAGSLAPTLVLLVMVIVGAALIGGYSLPVVVSALLFGTLSLTGVVLASAATSVALMDLRSDTAIRDPVPSLVGLALAVVFVVALAGTVAFVSGLAGAPVPVWAEHPLPAGVSVGVLGIVCAIIVVLVRKAVARLATLDV